MKKMNPEIKQKWVSALRSGSYEQGRCWLRTKDMRFCCLGVLCDLHCKETNGAWSNDAGGSYLNNAAFLPPVVVDWAGLPDVYGTFTENARSVKLTLLNDAKDYDFNKIADAIETNF